MAAICIETETKNPEVLRSRLMNQMETWRRSGLVQEYNETNTGAVTIWDCKTDSNHQAKNLQRLTAQVLADYIVTELEPVLLRKLANLHHPHLIPKDLDEVCDRVRQRLIREESLTGESRRQRIFRKIEQFLSEEGLINVDGFLRFRLQEYQRDLLIVINQCADDFLIEREYQDFINLLRYFVDIQPARFPEVHVMRKQRDMIVYDPEFKVLHREPVRDIEGVDAIVSTLVTTAPKRVIVHVNQFSATDELVSTIHSIFEERVSLCLGCEHCSER